MKKHIVFDFDDTISNSYPYNQDIFVKAFREFGYKGDDKVLRHIHFEHRGGSMLTQFELAIKELKLNFNAHKMLKLNQDKLHPENIDKMTIFPGFEEFIKSLSTNSQKVSILTNRPKAHLDIVLKKYKLTDYFLEVISCFDEGHEKPNPKCFLDLMGKYDFEKADYIYIGDSKTDAEFARNAEVDYLIIDHYLNQERVYENILSLLIK